MYNYSCVKELLPGYILQRTARKLYARYKIRLIELHLVWILLLTVEFHAYACAHSLKSSRQVRMSAIDACLAREHVSVSEKP